MGLIILLIFCVLIEFLYTGSADYLDDAIYYTVRINISKIVVSNQSTLSFVSLFLERDRDRESE